MFTKTTLSLFLPWAVVLMAALDAPARQDHTVRVLTGPPPGVALDAKIQIVSESWNRVVAVPYIVYMPEKQRVLMLVGCDYPHHPEVLHSDDEGATWSAPRRVVADGTNVDGLGTCLTYLGAGRVLFLAGDHRWVSEDFGETWSAGAPVAQTIDAKPWYTWDPLWLDRDPASGAPKRLIETGYTWLRAPEVDKDHQQGYIRFSDDLGTTWTESLKPPQWKEVSEVALVRAANGDLVAACRTDIPPSKAGEWIDHFEGIGISVSQDDGATWSQVEKLYDYGRHHPSLVLLPDGRLLMTYVVRKGYVDTPDGYPQFGVEAILSDDNGRTWDLDHRYILNAWKGNRTGENGWWASCQATSTVLLPDGALLTAFGTGYRSQPDAGGGNPSPRDAGLVRWHLSDAALDDTRVVRDAPVDSDARNIFDPAPYDGQVAGSQPFQGRPQAIPGVVEAEHFDEGPAGVAYYDVDEKNQGADYREPTQVDIEARPDASNKHGIGWIREKEWLIYTVEVREAGEYTLEIPVASNKPGGAFHIEFNGKDVSGPITIPDTGGWEILKVLTVEKVMLEAGRQPMKLVMDKDGESGGIGDIDLVRFTKEKPAD